MNFEDPPKFDNMPKPHSVQTLIWQDIWDLAKVVTQGQYKRDPTQQEIRDIFENIIKNDMVHRDSSFLSAIEHGVESYYENMEKSKNSEIVVSAELTLKKYEVVRTITRDEEEDFVIVEAKNKEDAIEEAENMDDDKWQRVSHWDDDQPLGNSDTNYTAEEKN